jgi:hypothetical protein
MDDALRATLRSKRLPEDADGLMRWLIQHGATPHVERLPNHRWAVGSDLGPYQIEGHGRSVIEALARLARNVAAREA